MTQQPPQVHIAGRRMDDHKLSDMPLLSGIEIGWGTADLMDYDPPATLTAELLVRQSAIDLGFLKRGAGIAVLSPDGALTFFAGAITGLTARRHPSAAGAWVIGISAAGKISEIEDYEIGPFRWPNAINSETGNAGAPQHALFHNLRATAPPTWNIAGAPRLPQWGNPAVGFKRKGWLWLLDAALRGQRMRRWDTTTYAAGRFHHEITITSERPRGGSMPNAPVVRLPAGNITDEIEWAQDPGDLITEISLTAHSFHNVSVQVPVPGDPNRYTLEDDPDVESEATSLPSDRYVSGIRALQQTHGYHSVSLDVLIRMEKWPADAETVPQIPGQVGELINPYLFTETPWRPRTVQIADSRLLSDATVSALLDVTRRHSAYAVLTDLPANNPSRAARVEAHVTGGSAAWNGKKTRWDFTLTLGRQTAATGTPKGL